MKVSFRQFFAANPANVKMRKRFEVFFLGIFLILFIPLVNDSDEDFTPQKRNSLYRFWYIKRICVLRNGELIYERKITDITINGIERNGKK